MILEIDRGHIKVQIHGKTAIVQGEMFFPGNDKMGFVIYLDTIKYWEPQENLQEITNQEVDAIVADIKADFDKGGHVLEMESA